jgi:predicted CXXCH cytochrome family protein
MVAAVLGFVFAWSSAMAQSIVGTPHDFKARGWGSGEVCIFCHATHNASATPLAPLWNHANTAATFTVYQNTFGTLNATDVGQPGGVSKACLSCHDGTIAIDSYGTRTGATNMTGGALLGTALGNDHPIGFTYNAALATADGALVTPASASQVVAGVPLFVSKMECASCHNVHTNVFGNFLRSTNAASALCLKCHVK